MFCSNGPIADRAVVYALTDKAKGYHGGITAFLVPCDAPGFSVGQTFEKMGLRNSPIGELLFEDVYVPEENVIGRVGGGAPVFAESMRTEEQTDELQSIMGKSYDDFWWKE